jgi:mRNA interferase MazF
MWYNITTKKRKEYITMKTRIVYRGEIYYADLSPSHGSEQGGLRPVLIIQNDVGNRHSTTTIIAPITSRLTKKSLPTHVSIEHSAVALEKDGIILLEQIRTIDKDRLRSHIGLVSTTTMAEVDKAIKVSLGV